MVKHLREKGATLGGDVPWTMIQQLSRLACSATCGPVRTWLMVVCDEEERGSKESAG